MTDKHIKVDGPLPVTAGSVPLGISDLPESGLGVDLAAHRYVEEEYLVTGGASAWTYDGSWRAVVDVPDVAYTTRIMVRRPSNPSNFSGVVHVEPLHPSFDRGLTWRTAAPLILREGHAWVGITQHPACAALLRDFSAERYGRIDIPMPGLGWEIVGGIGQLLRSPEPGNPLGDLAVRQAYLSGWSFTGTFCRMFLQEGFHQRHRQPDGRPVFDGYLIGISSGGSVRGGYHPLSEQCPLLPADHPRRTIWPADVPVIELMSEFESETNQQTLRPDSDEPDDRYRLYQVAGSAHASAVELSVEEIQLAGGGNPPPRHDIRQLPISNRNRHRVARSAYHHLHRWAAEGITPPRAGRLELMPSDSGGVRGLSAEALPLRRDEHDNAVGGVRTTWADVPVASYIPHSTPGDSPDTGQGWRPPGLGRAASADLTGHQIPFPPAKLARLYGSHGEYLARVQARAGELVRDGWLLLPDADDLIAEAADSAHRWDGVSPAADPK
jgi:hypothetical protein